MASLNKVQLIGRLGQEPEIRNFQNGGRICNLSIATSEKWKDKETGEKKERTQWHKIVISNDGLITLCEKYINKGHNLYIEGQLETRKYTDKDGVDKYTTEVVLRPYKGNIIILDSGKKDTGETNDFSSGKINEEFSQSSGGNFSSDTIDDEIPF